MVDNNNTMEYRIGLEKQNKLNDQVTELILDNCRASQISGLTDEFVNLETLSLINVGLVTLKGFPKLPKLKKLELSDNRLTGGLNLLHGSPKLQHLNISGNRIRDLEALEPLKEFHDLVTLDLYNCEVTKADDYRKKVFELVPNLHSLDGYDRNEREVADSDESDDEGSDVDNRITRDNNDSDDDDEDDDDDDDDEEGGSSEYDEEEYNGGNFDEEVDNEEFDEEDDEEDGAEDEDADGDFLEEQQGEGVVAEDEEDESGLKQLEDEFGDGDSEDDDDFEPDHEPDERDHEIDLEDDADEDADQPAEPLPTSDLNPPEATIDDTSKRGTKRKFEDEGGDEEAVDE